MQFTKLLCLLLLLIMACHPKPVPQDASVWKKVKINFRQLDAEGLSGPANGKVATHYEFCIPKDEKKWSQVQKIDPSAQRQMGSKGRIACNNQQWLILGNTHQKQYLRVLYDLASLSYISSIEETVFE